MFERTIVLISGWCSCSVWWFPPFSFSQPNYKYTIRVWYVGICNLCGRGFVWVGGIEPPVFKCACEKSSLFLSLQQDYQDQWTKRIGTSWPHLNHSGRAGFSNHSGPLPHTPNNSLYSVSHTFTLKHHPSETPTLSAPSFVLTYVC